MTAGRLSVDRHKLIGHLHELWWWALDNAGVDGELTGLSHTEIAAAAQWDGDSEGFVEALIYAGFIDRNSDTLLLHDWYDYAGKLIKTRQDERDRSRRRREKPTRSTSGQPAVNQRSTVGTVPNRTVPKDLNSLCVPSEAHASDVPPATPAPKKAKYEYAPEFEEFWQAYPRRVVKRDAYTAWKARLKDRLDNERGGAKVTAEMLLVAARNYAEECRRYKREVEKVKHPSTFLSAKHPFADYLASPPSARRTDGTNLTAEYLAQLGEIPKP